MISSNVNQWRNQRTYKGTEWEHLLTAFGVLDYIQEVVIAEGQITQESSESWLKEWEKKLGQLLVPN